MNRTPIEWCDFTSNPLKFRAPDGRVVWACEKLSPGCTNCYAEYLSTRYGGSRRAGDWNAGTMATLTPFLDERELRHMLTAKVIDGKPVAGSRCFPFDMTDLFGEWVPDELIDRVFAVFALRQDVTWQVLTKRAERMRDYLNAEDWHERVELQLWEMHTDDTTNALPIGPLKNVWLGVSVENPTFLKRIDELLNTPAAVRFVSIEPLLADLGDISRYLRPTSHPLTGCVSIDGEWWHAPGSCAHCRPGLDWVIVGGESGAGARPCCLSWLRNIVHDCADAKVPCFIKQVGARPYETTDDDGADGECRWPIGTELRLKDRKGGTPTEWPTYLRVRQFPEGVTHGS